MDKVTGMMREDMKSIRDQMETLPCMSLEGREWSISIVEQGEAQECGDVIYLIVVVYSRVSTSTLGLYHQVFTALFSLMLSYSGPIFHITGALFNPPSLYFSLDSEVSEDPPQFTLTCVSRGGPATQVMWRRDGKEITENSTYSTSQIIVDTSRIAVYNNTLRVRGREGGVYRCAVTNSQSLSLGVTAKLTLSCKWLYPRYFYGSLFMLNQIHQLHQISLYTTYKSPSTVLLEWMFSDPVVGDTMYTVYYQSGGVSYNASFTLTEDQRLYLMMDLPLEVIKNVFIVAEVTRVSTEFRLPSPVVGPALLGRLHNATLSFL